MVKNKSSSQCLYYSIRCEMYIHDFKLIYRCNILYMLEK